MLLVPVIGWGGDDFTKLLLHCDGVDASTTFTDSSPSLHTVTASGNAQIDTAQFKFGTASALFDGNGDWLALDASIDFAFGTGDFTIDFWMRPANVSSGNRGLYDGRDGSTVANCVTIYQSATNLILEVGGSTRISGGTLSANTWQHVALVRSAGTSTLYLGGTAIGSPWTDATNYTTAATGPYIGRQGPSASFYYNGWIDEYRVSKGIARWTGNFTPPTSAYS